MNILKLKVKKRFVKYLYIYVKDRNNMQSDIKRIIKAPKDEVEAMNESAIKAERRLKMVLECGPHESSKGSKPTHNATDSRTPRRRPFEPLTTATKRRRQKVTLPYRWLRGKITNKGGNGKRQKGYSKTIQEKGIAENTRNRKGRRRKGQAIPIGRYIVR